MTLLQAKNDLFLQLQSEQDTLADCEEKIVNLVEQKADYENQIKEYEERLNEEESNCESLEAAKRRVSRGAGLEAGRGRGGCFQFQTSKNSNLDLDICAIFFIACACVNTCDPDRGSRGEAGRKHRESRAQHPEAGGREEVT